MISVIYYLTKCERTEEDIEKIDVLQKKCARILTFSSFNSHTDDIFKDIGILKVTDVIEMH